MSKSKPKKDKVPKITEEEYAAYLSSLRAASPEAQTQETEPASLPDGNG